MHAPLLGGLHCPRSISHHEVVSSSRPSAAERARPAFALRRSRRRGAYSLTQRAVTQLLASPVDGRANYFPCHSLPSSGTQAAPLAPQLHMGNCEHAMHLRALHCVGLACLQ